MFLNLPAYDEDFNFSTGVNLKAIFMSYKDYTHEDACVISQSVADRVYSYKVDTIDININNNDIPLNLYGDLENYKPFPMIGEEVTESKLIGLRRLSYERILASNRKENLLEINDDDQLYYSKNGTVVDIEIFSNCKNDSLNNEYLDNIHKINMKYHEKIYQAMKEIIVNNCELDDADPDRFYKKEEDITEDILKLYENISEEFSFLYKNSREYLDSSKEWIFKKSKFENIVLRFKVLSKKNLKIGDKLTNRHG